MNFSVHQSKGSFTVALTSERQCGKVLCKQALTAVCLMDFKPDLPHPFSELTDLSSSKRTRDNWAAVIRFICFSVVWSLESLF